MRGEIQSVPRSRAPRRRREVAAEVAAPAAEVAAPEDRGAGYGCGTATYATLRSPAIRAMKKAATRRRKDRHF